jgi:hypothetical protein
MKMILALLGGLFLASSVLADPYSMAIQQAKRASDQNNAEQQRIANQDGGNSSAPGQAVTADPNMAATLQNITNLESDFSAVITANGDPADQKIALLNDFSAAAQGTKASSASVRTLAKDMMTAISGNKKLEQPQQLKIAREVHAMFNSSHLAPDRQQAVLNDLQKTLTDAGVSPDAVTNVVTDLKTIASETQ